MKFTEVITIDWYDNILIAFCMGDNNVMYYCSVLAINQVTNEKIYLCLDSKYLKGQDELLEIIKLHSFTERWNDLTGLIDLKNENETYLIKSKDLNADNLQPVKFKINFKCSKYIIWGDCRYLWDRGEEINNWLVYKKVAKYLSL